MIDLLRVLTDLPAITRQERGAVGALIIGIIIGAILVVVLIVKLLIPGD